MQIRPAEYPSERENKVFVGMLNKSLTEPDLEMMFAPYGELKEVDALDYYSRFKIKSHNWFRFTLSETMVAIPKVVLS